MVNKIYKLSIFKNTDLFQIKSFVVAFTIYSLISIWLSHASSNKDKNISELTENIKVLKSEYVSTKTVLMSYQKQSYLIKKANSMGFYSSIKKPKIIQFSNED